MAEPPSNAAPRGRLTTAQAADLLGVKTETLYAYVSRRLLTSQRTPGGRASTFDAAEVEKLARRTKGEHGGVITGAGGRAFSFRTSITLIEHDRLWFRGVDAIELARAHVYEEVADWLWTGELRPGLRFAPPDALVDAARNAVGALPHSAGMLDRLRAAAIAAAAADPLRFEFDEHAVIDTARNLIGTLVEALPCAAEPDFPDTLAGRLWSRLTARTPDESSIAALNGALVLLADHDLAVSTLSARVAASSRAHPYAVVSAALGALDGPLHGAASGLAHRMLAEVVERGSAAPVVAAYLRAGPVLPGIGHRVYQSEDPRATALFEFLERVPAAADALAAAREVCAVAARHATQPANVDLALAVLSVGARMPADAGETIFAVARIAGWIAHSIEEYAEAPLRLRLAARYAGPRPPQPMP
ncbi:citrate synthase [Antricoccus suffuscus]|uniref:citrate synthase (unknown stereospecificity) n=1 Tax=Antricoccus suffuscus TaxID=1629062 RepID=A0A2T1A1W2_9ACTN|nr:citrate/2-methylcitrate synthase [Antricoccus suffuscus]PRZ42599.1 citrate synthase [Antricoccus suffuscus]